MLVAFIRSLDYLSILQEIVLLFKSACLLLMPGSWTDPCMPMYCYFLGCCPIFNEGNAGRSPSQNLHRRVLKHGHRKWPNDGAPIPLDSLGASGGEAWYMQAAAV